MYNEMAIMIESVANRGDAMNITEMHKIPPTIDKDLKILVKIKLFND